MRRPFLPIYLTFLLLSLVVNLSVAQQIIPPAEDLPCDAPSTVDSHLAGVAGTYGALAQVTFANGYTRRAYSIVSGGRYVLNTCDYHQQYNRNLATYKENQYTGMFESLYFSAQNNCGAFFGISSDADGEFLVFDAEYTGVMWVVVRESFSDGDHCVGRNRVTNYRPDGHVNFFQRRNITVGPLDPQSVHCGSDARFTASASVNNSNLPEFTYQWQRFRGGIGRWEDMVGEVDSMLEVLDVAPRQFGAKYRVGVGLDQIVKYSESAKLLEAQVDPPTNVQASNDNCNSEVEITWEWYTANPISFLIEFSLDGGSTWVDLVEASGSDRSYVHEGVERGMGVLYRMRTYSDSCGHYTSSSSVITGISPLAPLAPIDIDAQVMDAQGGQVIQISFEDTSNNEDGFYVDKIFQNGSIDRYTVESTREQKAQTGDIRFYEDPEIANCEPYSYRAYSYNVCAGDGVRDLGEVSSVTVSEDIDNVITLDALETSKGYYTDKVDLEWSFNPMGSYSYISRYKIFARGLGTDDPPQLLSSQINEVHSLDHTTANASYLYEYFVVAEGECGDQIIRSYNIEDISPTMSIPEDLPMQGVAYDIGFRSPAGIINGNISYNGGVAVQDVRVLVERGSEAVGTSLYFDGDDDYLDFPFSSYLESVYDVFSLSMWLRPGDLIETSTLFSLSDIAIVELNAGIVSLSVRDSARALHTIQLDNPLDFAQYVNLFITYDHGIAKIYLDGELAKEEDMGTLTMDVNHGYMYVGGIPTTSGPMDTFYTGHIDEIRLYGRVISAVEIFRDYSRYVDSDGEEIVGYWKFNEGRGPYVFDIANTLGLYHGTDGKIYGAQWLEVIPDASQLGVAGYTDRSGNYRVNEILFKGNGENFTITPSITLSGSVHAFTPNQRTLFIGTGNTSLNSIDFTDVSSFAVSGYVLFEYDGTLSGSNEVSFYLDGAIPITNADGSLVTSDADGYFEIQVPIGLHYFQARKAFHEFGNDGKFPSLSPTYDFQDIVTGVEIIDTTRRKFIGRVVGGTREGDKAVGFNKSFNNIGNASFVLVATDNTFRIPVNADPDSNEYTVEVPPKKYNLYKVSPPNELGINVYNNPLAEAFFQGLDPVDLSDKAVEQQSTDTIYTHDDPPVIDEILAVPYHLKRNYVYRSTPLISVADGMPGNEGAPFEGEEFFVYENTLGVIDTIQLNYHAPSGIPFPVFNKGKVYATRVMLQERYVNLDNPTPVEDFVAVSDGTFSIANYLGKGFYVDENGLTALYAEGLAGTTPDVITIDESSNGTVDYSFFIGSPATTLNTADPSFSFTKTMQITARAGGNVVYWPGPGEQDVFRGYIFGGNPVGSSFITEGPDVVDFILRDPPGSGSSSSIQEGESVTRANDFSLNNSLSYDLVAQVGFGVSTFMGAGIGAFAGTISSSSSTVDLGFHLSTGVGYNGQWVETYTTQTAFSTSGSAGLVGASGDVYVGKSQNYQYGNTSVIALVPTANCSADEVICPFNGTAVELTSNAGQSFQVGSKIGLFLSPGGNTTMFAYTQSHIENILVPRLEGLRNTLLNDSPNYTPNIPGTHPLYARNNDDAIWARNGETPSTDSPYTTELADFAGPSYTFVPQNNEMDSVRWYNQQVRLWQEAIEANEREKAQAQASGDAENVSFSAGAPYSASMTTSSDESNSVSLDLTLGADIGVTSRVDVIGVSVRLAFSVGVSMSTSYSYSYSTSDSTTYGYNLSESEGGDFLSVDIYDGEDGNGPIFLIADGGETSCPHEPAYFTKYHQPGTQLGAATLQRQKARLEVRVPEVFNIPSDEAANFVLIMNNESESNDDFDYTLSVEDYTNPNGASLFVDGAYFDERRTFGVPGGGAIQKVVTMERGPYEYDYEGVDITMASTCDGSISSTVSLSAHYLPSCTEVRISNPTAEWTVNNTFNDLLQVAMYDYDINYPGLKHVRLSYRPTSVAGWITLDTFYRDASSNPDLPADASEIPRDVPVIRYDWLLESLADGEYELMAEASCEVASTGTIVSTASSVHRGIIDRITPHAFGNPQPADGVLSPNDEIFVQFNERVNEGLLSPQNFDIRGMLNGGEIRHGASVFFNGVSNHFMRIPQVDISQRSFSFDFYAKRVDNNPGVIVGQGDDNAHGLQIGFNSDNRLYFHLVDRTFIADDAIVDGNWHHYAITYDYAQDLAVITIDAQDVSVDNAFAIDYLSSGRLLVGKSTYSPEIPFKGNVHEFRIWNKVLSQSDIVIAATTRLNKSTAGLLSNWKMEEAEGTVAKDHIRGKHAQVQGTWDIYPRGRAVILDGISNYLTAPPVAFGPNSDFTIEFCFRSDQAQEATVLSNGTGEGADLNAIGDSNPTGWAMGLDVAGNVVVQNNNSILESRNINYHDNLWHHVGVSVNRVGNATLYVDGEEAASVLSAEFNAFGGPKIWIGARGWFAAGVENRDEYFKGGIDDVRVWQASRRGEQISNHKQYKLMGDEIGVLMYYPFEQYTRDFGVYVVTSSLSNELEEVDPVYGTPLTNNGAVFTENAASIKLPLPVATIPFTFSSNNDRIVLSPTLDTGRIENVLLDVSVADVQDVHGNEVASPITWGAYVDKNQVVWAEERKIFEVELNEPLSFSVDVRNTGGEIHQYSIFNLPEWLSASPSSGTLPSLASTTIHFSIEENAHVGVYSEDVYLRTGFGFDERLTLDLTIYQLYPQEWAVAAEDYQYAMSVVGQLEIDGVISRNPDNAIVVLVGEETRGITKLAYVEGLDAYYLFLSIYSNQSHGESLDLRVWNSQTGRVHANLVPTLVFENDRVHGSFDSPVIFQVPDYIRDTQPLQRGWQWLSFNLEDPAMSSVNTFMSDYEAQNGDIIKTIEDFDQYDEVTGWLGSITSNGGLKPSQMYKFNLHGEGLLAYQGGHINPEDITINLRTGWNWIGYPLHRNLGLEAAFANLDPQVGDQVKGQLEFAVYAGQGVGWIGSLQALRPGEGYMYKSVRMTSFSYPDTSGFRVKEPPVDTAFTTLPPTLNYGDYQSNMSIVAMVAEGSVAPGEHIVVSVKNRDRGLGVPRKMGDEEVFFITVLGNGVKEEVAFYLVDSTGARLSMMANRHVDYKNDAQVGDISDPLVLNRQSTSVITHESIAIFPNPVRDVLRLILHNKEERLHKVDFFSTDGHMFSTFTNEIDTVSREFVLLLHDFVGGQRGFIILNVRTNLGVHTIKIVRE